MDYIAEKLTKKNACIPSRLLAMVLKEIGLPLPHYYRGIKITEQLIKATLEYLNETSNKTLPQNCKNEVKNKLQMVWIIKLKREWDLT